MRYGAGFMFLSDVVQVRTAEKDRLVLIIGGGPGHGPDRLASGGRSLRTSRPTRRCWVTSTLGLARDCWRTSTICWSWRCARESDGRPAPRGARSTANRERPPSAVDREASTRAIKSRAASAISSPTPKVAWSGFKFTPRISKTVMARQTYLPRSARSILGCAMPRQWRLCG